MTSQDADYFSSTMRSMKTSARIATPSSRNSGKLTAPVILSAAAGCRAIPSAAADANRAIPKAAPITTMPRPSAAPKKCRNCIPLILRLVVNVNGHADEHGREKRKYVSLNQNNNDFEHGDAD